MLFLILVAGAAVLYSTGHLSSFLGLMTGENPVDTTSPTVERFVPTPPGSSGEHVSVTYQWEYRQGSGKGATTHPFNLTLNIPEDLYTYYKNLERPQVSDYSVYVTHPSDDDFLQSLVDALSDMAAEKGFDSAETASFVASFVQDRNSIDYALDAADSEYPKYPIETLKEKEGDCEDSSILIGALLKLLGYEAVLVNFPALSDEEAGHMGLGVAGDYSGASYTYEDTQYYYLETTDVWGIGEIPDDFKTRQATLYAIEPISILTFTYSRWTITQPFTGPDTVTLKMTVRNWGTSEANDARIRASFDGQSWIPSDTFDLQPGYEVEGIEVELNMPSEAETLLVQLIDDQLIVDDTEIDLEQ